MNISKKSLALSICGFAVLTVASGLIFFYSVVSNELTDHLTNILSIIYGWQWFYLALLGLLLLIFGAVRQKGRLIRATLIVIASLIIVVVPAQVVYSSRYYITGEGGPAGPNFDCLVWKNPDISGVYGDQPFRLCTFMSIPRFNKFLIDQSRDADQSDNSVSYYGMLALNEAVLVYGLVLAYRQIKRA